MSVYAPIKAIVTDQERAFELDCRLFNRNLSEAEQKRLADIRIRMSKEEIVCFSTYSGCERLGE